MRIDDFFETYLLDIFNKQKAIISSNMLGSTDVGRYDLTLSNSELLTFWVKMNLADYKRIFFEIIVDTNGMQKPNQFGIDRFIFYLVPKGASIYNAGDGSMMYNVPRAGLYWAGYGISNNKLKTSYYKGCSKDKILNAKGESYPMQGTYCIALIVKNNWKIPDDYPKKF